MSQSLAITITLCHQFKSKYYESTQLKSCIIKATQEAEDMLDGINMVFEDIEDATHDNQVHANVTKSIRKSHIIIFEISDLNPNVIYELGIASALGKPVIILRELESTEPLPTDINQFIYITYHKDELDTLGNKLALKIMKAYSSYNEIDFVSDILQEKIVDNFMQKYPNDIFTKLDQCNLVKVLTSTDDFIEAFKQTLSSTKRNFYYLGTMGFLSSSDQWFDYETADSCQTGSKNRF